MQQLIRFKRKMEMDTEIVITDSRHKDFIHLISLLDADLGEHYGELQKQYNKYNKVDLIKDVVILYQNQQPVGCGAFKAYDEKSVEIKRVFVRKDHRGKGLSKVIVHELEIRAINKGYSFAVLETGIKQTEAIHLYQSLGYHLISNYGPYEGMENSVCMKKKLT